jgi:hypothetical protein
MNDGVIGTALMDSHVHRFSLAYAPLATGMVAQ